MKRQNSQKRSVEGRRREGKGACNLAAVTTPLGKERIRREHWHNILNIQEMDAKVRSNYAWVRIGHTRRPSWKTRLQHPVAQLPRPARTSNADAVRAGHHSGDPPGRQGQPIEIFVPPAGRVFRGPRFRMLHRDGWDGLRSIVGGKETGSMRPANASQPANAGGAPETCHGGNL